VVVVLEHLLTACFVFMICISRTESSKQLLAIINCGVTCFTLAKFEILLFHNGAKAGN
jgi:hypothetical protein